MKKDTQPPEKNAKRWRRLLIPVAFAWLFLLLAAPLMLLDERYGLIAAAAGFIVGAIFALAAPQSVFEKPSNRPKEALAQGGQLPPNRRLAPTGLSIGLAAYTGYFLATNSVRDRSPFVVFAAILVIGLIRRPLRMAWGINGSIAGISISGALIVLLVRSATSGMGNGLPSIIGFSAMVLGFELFNEWRALQRSGFFEAQESKS